MRIRSGPRALPGALLLLTTALAGCSATGSAAATIPASTAAAPAVTIPASTAAAPQASVAPPVASAMADGALSDEHCQKSADGTWTYTARLTNHDPEREVFTVAIGLTRATAVLDHAVVQKTLGPGESADVSATGFGKDVPLGGTDCGATISKERAE